MLCIGRAASQVDEAALVVGTEGLTVGGERIGGAELGGETGGIDHGDQGVEIGDVAEAFAGHVAEFEGGGESAP